jgi:hypothetical protein
MKIYVFFILLLTLCGCKTRYVSVPVETVKTEKEYVDKWRLDSIYIRDSVMVQMAGDTVFIEKYKYLYRDRLLRDSVFIVDSIRVQVPYPVEVVKEINRLHNWQIILMVLGGAALGYVGFRVYRLVKG